MAALSKDDIGEYLAFAETLADAARVITLSYFRTALEVTDKNKGQGERGLDPVTAADREAEAAIRERIRAAYPDHAILGEEEGLEEGAAGGTPPVTWVIDPIDGTRTFISGLPNWGILIAINDGAGAVAGVADMPALGERFSGGPAGAFMDGKPVTARACPELAQAILCCTDRNMFANDIETAAFDAVAARARLTRFGTECYGYCLLAAGFVDLVVEGDLKPYDVQALAPIVRAAGGVITTWDGGAPDDGGLIVAAGDQRVHAQALDLLGAAMTDKG